MIVVWHMLAGIAQMLAMRVFEAVSGAVLRSVGLEEFTRPIRRP